MARLIAYLVVGIFCAVGPLLLLIAIVLSIRTAGLVSATVAADGTIVEFQRDYSTRRSKEVYFPVFRFVANDGRTYMIRADSNASFVPFKPGDHVRILYFKDHPETARINSIAQLWMPQLILGFVGLVFTPFSVRIIQRRPSRRNVTTAVINL